MKIFLLILGLAYVVSACDYRCPSGRIATKPNTSYTPKPNGCGTKGMTILKNLNPQFTPCCNNHDRCYGRCNSGKSSCDTAFLNCMKKTCGNAACKAGAESYYWAVKLFGCTSYTNIQKKACKC